MHPFSSSMNQRQFPASLNRFLTWLMLIAALVAVAILLAAPGVVLGQAANVSFKSGHNPPTEGKTIEGKRSDGGTRVGVVWHRSETNSGTDSGDWAEISSGSWTYVPTSADVGHYLRVSFVHRVSGETEDRTDQSPISAVVVANTAPTVSGVSSPAVDEGHTGTVATYTATDIENEIGSWNVSGPDAARFSIDAIGALTFNDPPDYEIAADDGSDNTYNVDIVAADNAPVPLPSERYAVVVTVNNVDEDGTLTLSPATTPRVGVQITASLSDPDGGVSGETWQWQNAPDDTATWTDITGAASASYTPLEVDVGKLLRATTSYTDAHGSGKSATSDPTAAVAVPSASGADQLAGHRRRWAGHVVVGSCRRQHSYRLRIPERQRRLERCS